MSVNMPALWYEVGMHCAQKSPDCIYNFRGFSLPGVPGILIGHNDRIAWGLTNAAFDAEDVFIERVNPENPNQYEVNGTWQDMTLRREEIVVRGQEAPHVIVVRSTRHGVVASDTMVDNRPFGYDQDAPELYALAYAWTALEPVNSVHAVLHVLHAQNWQEFNDALADFDAGKQNWLYADVDGNIGYVLPGRIPIRAAGDGTLPVPGWNDDFAWTGFIPYEDAPRAYNPAKGYIVTANNPQVRAEEYPYLLGIYQDRGQRAARLDSLIRADTDGISIEEAAAFQTDNGSISAREIIPYLAELPFADSDVAGARDRLVKWGAQIHMNSPEAALFNLFWAQLVARTFDDQVPPDQSLGVGTYTSDIVHTLLKDPGNDWWDDILATPAVVENREDILAAAFEAAYADGVGLMGKNMDKWRWGDLHTITFRNATLGKSGIGLIENIFNRGPFPTSGSESVPQKTGWGGVDDYSTDSIPALRQVIDLGDLDNSRLIFSVGQSGHPMADHYDDLIELWRTMQYHPSNWSRANAEAGQSETLVLTPPAG
jgi:penicillin amidase